MTAEEIRAMEVGETEYIHMKFICYMLQEIAAQLSELNEGIQELNENGIPVALCATTDTIPVSVS